MSRWLVYETTAEAMIPLIGSLHRQYGIVTTIYGKALINHSVIEIIQAHRLDFLPKTLQISLEDTYSILKILVQLKLSPATLDLGKLATKYKETAAGSDLYNFIKQALSKIIDKRPVHRVGQDIVLYGFGRIGRLIARILIERAGGGHGLNLKAIVVRSSGIEGELEKRVSLLERDSVHGAFRGTLATDRDQNCMIANGSKIQLIHAASPAQINYQEEGIRDAILVDNTGKWRNEDGLSQHLACPGIHKVLLTAPGKNLIKNIVYGVNEKTIAPTDSILSAASCTTNAVTPVLKVVEEAFGINHGHVETIHAYTNDQNLIDNFHKGSRRGRSAPLNMVLTETGAAKAVTKVLPALQNKLTGNAIRVPIPNVSMAILNLDLKKPTTKASLNAFLREIAFYSHLQKQIDYVESGEAVSSDFVGSHYACIVDGQATIVHDTNAIIYLWYDNEFGYSCQVHRILKHLSGVTYPTIP